jgi:VanZ family protein
MLWLPSKAVPKSIANFEDWILHGGVMAVGAVLLYFARRNQEKNIKFYLSFLFFFIVYSFITEMVQHFIPGRSFSLLDIVANMTGVVIVLIGVYFFNLNSRNDN